MKLLIVLVVFLLAACHQPTTSGGCTGFTDQINCEGGGCKWDMEKASCDAK